MIDDTDNDDDDYDDEVLDQATLLRKALTVLVDVEAYFNRQTSLSRDELDILCRASHVLTAAAHARIAGNI